MPTGVVDVVDCQEPMKILVLSVSDGDIKDVVSILTVLIFRVNKVFFLSDRVQVFVRLG